MIYKQQLTEISLLTIYSYTVWSTSTFLDHLIQKFCEVKGEKSKTM